MSSRRCFLFLQGPQSRFFRRLGLRLHQMGHKVIKVNFCGGDVVHWPFPFTLAYQGRRKLWPEWINSLFLREGVTDLLLFGDRRPMHSDAVLLAKNYNINIHVFEEGYLRSGYITMEQGGVNGRSSLPDDPDAIRKMAAGLTFPEEPNPIANPLKKRVWDAVRHHFGNAFLMPFFPLYRTHRPYTIIWELQGWIPRYLTRKKRWQKAHEQQTEILDRKFKYFLFPLQLDSDFQIRLYSDFSSLGESIMYVLRSFAKNAPRDHHLVIKNHPLDNGLFDYKNFSMNFARALGLENRIIFLDGGDGRLLTKNSRGVVVVNSTMGLEALDLGLPVYCLGRAIYAMPGLAVTREQMTLGGFWKNPVPCDPRLLEDYKKVLLHHALIFGNFYTDEGIEAAVQGVQKRLGVS